MNECSFCGKGEAEAGRLAPGTKASICGACLALCQDIVAGRSTGPGVGDDLACSFCGKDRRGPMVAGPVIYICGERIARFSSPESN